MADNKNHEEVKNDCGIVDSDSPYNLYNPLNPDCVVERIRYRQESGHQNNFGRGTDIHGSPIRLSSVSVGVDVPRICMCVEWTLIGVLICVVWLLLMIPTAFYINTYITSSGTLSSNDSRVDTANTTQTNDTESCSPVMYTGKACLSLLLSCQNGFANSFSNDSSVAYISSSVDQREWETKATLLLNFKDMISSTCRKKLIPFLCLYFFNLCNKESEVIFKPSMENCVELRNTLCEDDWKLAEAMPSLSVLIPDCDLLPRKGFMDTCISNQSARKQELQNVTCKDNFYLSDEDDEDGQHCLPECGVWSPYSDIAVKVMDGLVLSVVIFAIITSCVVLVFACLRCKRVFVFPTILIIYQTFSVLVFAVIVLIGYMSRSKLFCSSRNLWTSFFKPTPFCILSGIIVYYVLMQLVLLWLFHVTFVFWGTWWPINAKRFLLSGKGRCLHIVLLHLGLLLPAIPVVTVALSQGFTLTRLPPIMCAGPHVNANFFSMILPISIMIAYGASLLILIMRNVIKKHIIAKIRGQRHKVLWWSSEIKVLIILCYYVIFGVVVLTSFTIAMVTLNEFGTEVKNYFECESQPQLLEANITTTDNSTTCDRRPLERLVNPIPTTIAFIVIGIYPAVNLVYTWNYKELKEKWRSRRVQYVNRSNSTAVWFSKEAARATIRHPHSFSGAPK